MKCAFTVKEILDNLFEDQFFCIFDDDVSHIIYEDKVANALHNGTVYDDWIVIDIEVYGSDTMEQNGYDRGIMINAYNPELWHE